MTRDQVDAICWLRQITRRQYYWERTVGEAQCFALYIVVFMPAFYLLRLWHWWKS